MELSITFCLLTLTPLLSTALPSQPSSSGVPLVVSPGINASNHVPPRSLDCNNIQAGISPQCYQNLSMTAYLDNWNTSIRREVCAPSQSWSSCFQVNAYTNPGAAADSPNINTISQHHDCSTLTTNSSNSDKCIAPLANQKAWTPKDFYGAFNIYSLQHHISIWAQALAATTSQPAIETVSRSDTVSDSDGQTADSVLATLILKYGRDHDADDFLVRLLEGAPNDPNIPKRPSSAHGRVPTQLNEPTGASWQPVLHARLAEVLKIAMTDFEYFLEAVRSGAYSSIKLAVVGQLEEAMKVHPN